MSQDNRFKALNQELLRNSQSTLSSWFPNGMVRGREFTLGDLQGSTGSSLSINLDKGVWTDFATGESGADLISLYAASRGLTQGQAFNDLGGKIAKTKKKEKSRTSYRYTSDYLVHRVDFMDGSKVFFGEYQGTKKHHPEPRPLYFVEGFYPEKPFLIVEGEKAAHAAHKLIGQHYNVVTWPGGSNAFKKANWQMLLDKGPQLLHALIWPDFDEPGYKAAAGIAAILKPMGFDVSILDVKKNNPLEDKKGWDADDLLQMNWERPKFIEWAKSCKTDVGTFVEPPKETPEKKEKTKELKPIDGVDVIESSRQLDRLPERQDSEIEELNICHFQDIPGIEKNGSGKLISNTLNVRTILNFHPAFKGKFFLDDFYNTIFVLDGGKLRKIKDVDGINATMFMMKAGLDKISKNNVFDAIESVAESNRISQPKIEIESYAWDGVKRIDKFFTDYFVSEYPNEYLEAVGRNFWISMVARVYDPGCKVDNMVVIESKHEGIFKSTALAVIGGKYFSEVNGKMGSKDFLENSLGYFLLEDDELVATKSLSAEQQRSFMSRKSDTFRKSYGRFSNELPRQWVIVGTTNNDTYLNAKDSDGRRFWPVKVHKVELGKIKQDREQLFAEARDRYKAGESWWEVPKEIHKKLFDSKNEAEFSSDPWEEIIADYIYSFRSEDRGWVKTNDILESIIAFPMDRRTRKETNRVGRIMRDLGYEYAVIRDDEVVFKAWKKDVNAPMPIRVSKSEASEGPYSNNYGW